MSNRSSNKELVNNVDDIGETVRDDVKEIYDELLAIIIDFHSRCDADEAN